MDLWFLSIVFLADVYYDQNEQTYQCMQLIQRQVFLSGETSLVT